MEAEAEAILSRIGIRIDSVRRPIVSYSGGQRQAVALARAIRKKPKILLLDEPTAALGVREKFQVLYLIRRLGKEEDIPIILVSHNLEEVFEIVDRIVVLRNGQVVGDCIPQRSTKEQVVQMIVGGET
ncbi:MAG: ATP-binding cassette domain-containing protein [Candidatus Caldatribacteriaceae bacterium]